jgi:selenocysteine lyase/cysteine desulfurase
MGLLYGKYDLLAELQAYKVRPADDATPDKFETGTKNHEGIAGVLGALEYIEWVGETFGQVYADKYANTNKRRQRLLQGISSIRAYEFEISRAMLEICTKTPGVRLYGPSDPLKLEERVPTFAITVEGLHPRQVAEKLDKHNIYVWDGNYYALAVTERLGVEDSGGMVRIGPVHYNTLEEIERFGEVLAEIANQA